MASLTPRASGLWSHSAMSSDYFPDDDEDVEQQQPLVDSDDHLHDGRTPLDKTIDRIGMGSYQWALLSLCGFGWMADNMWIQAIAIILPRVQQHYSVPDSFIGSLSSSMFGGMMLGAVGWGTCSDLLGRSTAFNATLFFTALFGFFASFTHSFLTLCIALFFLGTAVGGSMPTDGTLLLEHMPKEKQYLVTALSVFFSFGSVLSAFVALLVLPQSSCPSTTSPTTELILCDVEKENRGWKHLLMTLALITLSMFLARIVFFRLHESPRYLVHAGRPHEAVKSLQMISKFNGSDLEIELDDVEDHHPHESPPTKPASGPPAPPANTSLPVDIQKRERVKADETTIFDAGDVEGTGSNSGETSPTTKSGSSTESGPSRAPLITQYDSIGQTPASVLEGHSFKTPKEEYPPFGFSTNVDNKEPTTPKTPRDSAVFNEHLLNSEPQTRRLSTATFRGSLRRLSSASSRRASVYEYEKKCKMLPKFIRRPLAAWWERVAMVLEPEWFRTTILVWAVWFAMSLAFTMFNVYFPKLLEISSRDNDPASMTTPKTLEENLWDVMIFTIGGTPGAILGAWLIESPLGRRWSLAASTFTTAVFCVAFVMVEATWAVRLTTVGISLSATAMWAVLYGWTPEIFGTKVRGTACGIASALSRIGGMIAPLLGGTLLMMSRAIPVYTSVAVFTLAGIFVLFLREGEGDSSDRMKTRARAVVH